MNSLISILTARDNPLGWTLVGGYLCFLFYFGYLSIKRWGKR